MVSYLRVTTEEMDQVNFSGKVNHIIHLSSSSPSLSAMGMEEEDDCMNE